MSKQQQWTGERLETFVQNETTVEHLHRYALAMKLVSGKKVLDIACGEGYGANLMAAVAENVIGIDIDGPTIRKAVVKYKKNNLAFEEGAIEKIPCPEHAFDIITCFETIEHVSDHDKVMVELKRVLKENGLLVLSTPDKKNYSDKTGYQNAFHQKELYREELMQLISKYFRNYHIGYQNYTSGSFILHTDLKKGLELYSGSYKETHSRQALEQTYFIAYCSDGELPAVNNSFFDHNLPIHLLLKEKEKEITSTITYRLGHFILYPLKFIRNLFKK